MNLNKYKKFESSIKDQGYFKSYKNIDKVMFFLSIFGHICSIFLAYFLVSKILSGAIVNNYAVVLIASILLLTGLELLKREIFDKFSLQQIKFKSFLNKDVLPLFIFSLLIVSISFYASLNGAKEFSNKAKDIDTKSEINIKSYEDSLSKSRNIKISEIDSSIKSTNIKIDQKDKEQTELESNSTISNQQKSRIKDLKSENISLKNDILKYESDETKIKSDLLKEIKEYESKVNAKGGEDKDENKSNSLLFVIISSLVEIVILAGVYFNKYYKFRSYEEFKNKIENDTSYQKWISCIKIIDVIYNDDTKINDRLMSMKSLTDLSKANGLNILNKDMIDILKILSSLNIIKTSGRYRYITKYKSVAEETLKKHFKIDDK